MNGPSSLSYALKNNRQSGFTLIEMTIVLVIVGIIISIATTIMPTLMQSAKLKKSQALVNRANHAAQGYLVTTQNLPYADSDKDGIADNGTYFGWLPYKTLGLSSGDDTWGNRLKYGVYADVVTQDLCNIIIPGTVDLTKLHTVNNDDATTTQQLYIIISGGDPRGTFEAKNADNDAEFDDPNRAIEYSGGAVVFNDLMDVGGINTLKGKVCTASSSSSTEVLEICDNGTDDDADGYTDCDDQDCFGEVGCGAGGANVVISTTSVPTGVVNSAYSATIQATGGTTPYEWTLQDKGGFSDLYIHTYTGRISGTLNQCPGTYTIQVKVEDSTLPADSGPKTDTDPFDIVVTTDLALVRTSDAGANITWSTAHQIETFQATGGHLGDIDWGLDLGGATGFVIESTGSNTCRLRKTGTSSAGSFTFTLTGTDVTCGANTAQLILNVTVEAAATGNPGEISGTLDTLEFDTVYGYNPSIVNISGDIYAIAYTGTSSDGYVSTVQIASDGQITNSVIDTLEFDTSDCYEAKIIAASGNYYIIAYRSSLQGLFLKTIQIQTDGQITDLVRDSYQFANYGYRPDIVNIFGDIFAVVYMGSSNDGFASTFEISSNGLITSGAIDTLEFDTSNGAEPDIINVSGNIYAVAYRGSSSDGFIKTLDISSTGTIADSVIDTWEFDTSSAYEPVIEKVIGDYFVVAYRGSGNDGFIKTIEISTTGQIIYLTLDTLEFDTINCYDPSILQISTETYAVVYNGPDSDGFLKTIDIISQTGQITDTVKSTFEFDTFYGARPDIIHIAGTTYAIAYSGWGTDGFLKTVEIQ